MQIAPSKMRPEEWNAFVYRHYPPIGAFMQTWEWGEFQKSLGRSVARYEIRKRRERVGVFLLVEHTLPLGFRYGYSPRGPVLDPVYDLQLVLSALRGWARARFPKLIFIRLEPPLAEIATAGIKGIAAPKYYIQPRHNTAVALDGSVETLLANLHSSTRSNISRAEKRGATVVIQDKLAGGDYTAFQEMILETEARNGGKNIFPSEMYLRSFFDTMPANTGVHDPRQMTLGIFYGYHEGEAAAAHFVLFFGDTATFLYGASRTKHLNSKVTTLLHWAGIMRAKELGLAHYDIGGVDETRWPSLTAFKQRFGGRTWNYAGNIDIIIRPLFYWVYNLLHRS